MAALKKLLPWLGAAGILAYLFSTVPVAAAWTAARAARVELFVPAMLVCVVLWFLVESRAFAYLFTRFNAPVTWAEARSLRGTTYFVTPINWNLGTAAIILHLRRSKSIGAVESTSSMLFYGLIDGIVLSGLMLIGAAMLPPSDEVTSLFRIAAWVEAGHLGLLASLMAPAPSWRWLSRWRGLAIFRSYRLATLRDLAVLVGLRAIYFGVFAALFWGGGRTFGIEVPAGIAVAATAPIMLATSLPITPAGIGTQAAAMLFFFDAYGDAAAILAFGLAFPVAQTLSRMLLGLMYVRDLGQLRLDEG